MGRPSLKEKILEEGLRVVHQRGFAGASVRDIVQAAGVPQGSFTNHFRSKEAFGLEILDRYFEGTRALMARTLLNDDLQPLERLSRYIDSSLKALNKDGMRNGCLFGNFTLGESEHSEPIRQKLVEIFSEMERAVTYCLKAAVTDGEVEASINPADIAGFIVSSLQGGYVLGKAEHSPVPVTRFKDILFSLILQRPDVLKPTTAAGHDKPKPASR